MAITEQKQSEDTISGQLLSAEERAACEKMAVGTSTDSQRAQSLVALDEGATQKGAAAQTGLTIWQVRYWLKKYKSEGMAIFPELEPVQPTVPETAVATEIESETDQSGHNGEESALKASQTNGRKKTKNVQSKNKKKKSAMKIKKGKKAEMSKKSKSSKKKKTKKGKVDEKKKVKKSQKGKNSKKKNEKKSKKKK